MHSLVALVRLIGNSDSRDSDNRLSIVLFSNHFTIPRCIV
jgi:hypothetical protein